MKARSHNVSQATNETDQLALVIIRSCCNILVAKRPWMFDWCYNFSAMLPVPHVPFFEVTPFIWDEDGSGESPEGLSGNDRKTWAGWISPTS